MDSYQFNKSPSSMEVIPNINYVSMNLDSLISLEAVFSAKIKNFHWNLTGMSFISLHKLLDKHYNKVSDIVDQVAEQLRKYGYASPGSFQEFLTINNMINGITESKGSIIPEKLAIEALILDHERIIQYINTLDISKIDLSTQSLLSEILDFHMKAIWMLKSHF